jgi:hypothetical protein
MSRPCFDVSRELLDAPPEGIGLPKMSSILPLLREPEFPNISSEFGCVFLVVEVASKSDERSRESLLLSKKPD